MISSSSKTTPAGPPAGIAEANGAADNERRQGQPKARLFALASLLWFFPSSGALILLVPDGARWFRADNWLSGLRSVAFEQWIAILILLMHVAFAVLARHFRRCEPLREEVDYEPDRAPGFSEPH